MLAAIAGFISDLLASSVVRFLAIKLVLSALFITVLPIVLNNLFYHILSSFLSSISSHFPDTQSVTVQLTGLAAFLADHLQLVSFVSILMSALALRLTFKLFGLLKPF